MTSTRQHPSNVSTRSISAEGILDQFRFSRGNSAPENLVFEDSLCPSSVTSPRFGDPLDATVGRLGWCARRIGCLHAEHILLARIRILSSWSAFSPEQSGRMRYHCLTVPLPGAKESADTLAAFLRAYQKPTAQHLQPNVPEVARLQALAAVPGL